MGLDEITSNAKDDKEEDDLEEVKDELGVEHLEDMEDLDDRLKSVVNSMMTQDKKIEELENELMLTKKALSTALREIQSLQDKLDDGEGDEQVEESAEEDIKNRWQ